jgi:cell wall-associated NlpC family hydrolase|nr:MAG TPA: NlpC/P60 family [Caudoviricetes sp.]
MTNEQKAVLRKIIYAVETGGQVYGQQDYSDFTEAYTNSSEEHAITIGAGAWYATESKILLERIYNADPEQWEKIDKVRLLEQVQTANWDCFNISRVSQLADTIIALISSDLGVKCQDSLMDEQLAAYADEALKQGVTDTRAQAMCVNFRHQGGQGAVTRILAKTKKPYTLDNLYAACQTDTGNQVGAYKSRQRFVYNALKKYFPEEVQDNMSKTEKATKQMESWAQDSSHGYDQDYRWGEKGDFDCSSAVIQAWQNAGVPVKTKGATYTGDMRTVFLSCGFKDVTSKVNRSTGSGLLRGDVLLNETHHVAMYCGNGKEVEASINEKGTAHGGQPGDQTGKEFLIRSYRNYPWDCVLRYSENGAAANDTVTKKQNTVAYVARMKKDSKCYTKSNTKSPSKLFPKLKKGAVVDVMKYTETDSSGLKWYFVRIPYPNDDGFVFEFVPKGVFTRISEIHK